MPLYVVGKAVLAKRSYLPGRPHICAESCIKQGDEPFQLSRSDYLSYNILSWNCILMALFCTFTYLIVFQLLWVDRAFKGNTRETGARARWTRVALAGLIPRGWV